MSLSTAVSDGVLAIATLSAAWMLFRSGRHWCAAWMLAIALAAVAGTIRFAGVDDLESLHLALGRWAEMVAFPSFCWAMARFLYTRRDVRAGESLAIAAGLNFVLLIAHRADIATAIGAVALIIAMFGATTLFKSQRNKFLMIAWAVGLYAIAGLWIGNDGTLGPLPRIDIYHYLLAAANVLFALALWLPKKPQPQPRRA